MEPRVLLSAYSLAKVADFTGSTGYGVNAGLVVDSQGNLYGTTQHGGTDADGTIFKVAAGTHTITTLASFTSSTGYGAVGSLIVDSSGNLYGNTQYGGSSLDGTVFMYTANSQSLSALASFDSNTGYGPTAGLLMDSGGNLYGATRYGGAGYGTVFELYSGQNSLTVIDDIYPWNGYGSTASLVMDQYGQLYGTAQYAGGNNDGTLFFADQYGDSYGLDSFSSSTGYGPGAQLAIDSNGNIFGTAQYGGSNSDGTVFEYDNGGGSILQLASFSFSTGYSPQSGVVRDSSGNLFGTTTYGGLSSDGTVFMLPSGSSTITAIASFNSSTGYGQQGGLAMDSNGNLFGVTNHGGGSSDGTVFEVSPVPPATKAVITSQPTTVTAGVSQSVSVSLENALGGIDINNSSSVTLSVASGPGGATIGGTLTVSAVNGVAAFSGLSFTKAGTYTVTATDGSLTPATTSTITVSAASANKLTIVQQPGGATAAQSIGTVIVDVQDAYGNLITTDTSTVSLSSSSAITGTASVSASGGVATFTGLSLQQSGSHTLTAADGSLTSAISNSFNIAAAAAAMLVFVQQPTDTAAGQAIGMVTVNFEDLYGNLVTTDTSTISVSSSSTIGGTTSVSAVGGVATFTGLSMTLAANYVLTATDLVLPVATSNSFNINPAAATHLVVTQQPTTTTAGQTIGTTKVSVEDTYGNIVTSDTSSVIVSTDVTLGGTTTVQAAGGIATFANLSITHSGSHSLSATDGSLTSATSNSFTINPSAASHLVVTQQPTTTTAGQTITATKVSIEDTYGNVVTTNTSSVTVSTDTTLGGTTTMTAVSGVATFADLSISLAGSHTLSATDGSLTLTTSNSFTINPAAATHLVFTQQPTTATAGQTIGTTKVSIEDTYGNVVTTNTSSVIVSTDVALGGTTTMTAVNGVASFANLSITLAGSHALLATDGSLSSATSNSFTINPAVATHLVITQQPTTATAGQTIATVTMDIEDAYGNLVTTDTSLVTVSTNTTLHGTTSAHAAGGIATFSDLSVRSAGSHTLSISDGSLPSTASNAFRINPAAAAQLVFNQQPTNTTAGQTIGAFTLNVADTYGNLVTTNTSTVTLTTPDGASLSGTTGVAAIGGIASFAGLSIMRAGARSLTAADSGLTSAASGSFTITPAAATTLVFTQQPADSIAGEPVPVVVEIEDAFGNLATSNVSTVTIATGDGTTLGGTIALQAVGGVATFTDPSITQAGNYTLSASDGSLAPTSSDAFNITPAAAAKLVVTQQPSATAPPGETIGTITVDVEDVFGNVVVTDQSNVTFSVQSTEVASVGSAPTGTTMVSAQGGVAVFSDLSIGTSGTYALTATDAALLPATTDPVTITPTNVVISGKQLAPIVIDSSTPFGQSTAHSKWLTVSVEDPSSNGLVVLKRNVRITRGQATIKNLNIHKAGDYTLVVSDGQGHSMTETFTVAPAAPAKLVFATQPVMIAGHGSASVEVTDRFGNLTTAADGMIVTLHLAPRWMLADRSRLSGTVTATVVNGVANFTDFSITKFSSARLVATAPKLSPAGSDGFKNVP
jgi:uncharacterized repeat protein (TIGR03803 family)